MFYLGIYVATVAFYFCTYIIICVINVNTLLENGWLMSCSTNEQEAIEAFKNGIWTYLLISAIPIVRFISIFAFSYGLKHRRDE